MIGTDDGTVPAYGFGGRLGGPIGLVTSGALTSPINPTPSSAPGAGNGGLLRARRSIKMMVPRTAKKANEDTTAMTAIVALDRLRVDPDESGSWESPPGEAEFVELLDGALDVLLFPEFHKPGGAVPVLLFAEVTVLCDPPDDVVVLLFAEEAIVLVDVADIVVVVVLDDEAVLGRDVAEELGLDGCPGFPAVTVEAAEEPMLEVVPAELPVMELVTIDELDNTDLLLMVGTDPEVWVGGGIPVIPRVVEEVLNVAALDVEVSLCKSTVTITATKVI